MLYISALIGALKPFFLCIEWAIMGKNELVDSFSEFARRKNIDKVTMIWVLEDVFRAVIRKKYGEDENFDIIINPDQGDLEIWRAREIVADDDELVAEHDKIGLTEAQKIQPDFEVGEEVSEQVLLENFGRRAVTMARQTLVQRVRSFEKDRLFAKYKDLVGEIILADIYQILSQELVLLDSDGNELILPKSMQIPKDRYRKGDQVRAIVHSVEMGMGSPRIILSRTSPLLLERLFESEVPEVYEGVITIKRVVRDPGERSKVVVESYDERVDPVGACVGIKGSRIHTIVRELCNENIDVINFTDNMDLYITRCLSPAKISSIEADIERKYIKLHLRSDQVSLALGKKGQNIRMASQLLGMEIDVFREITAEEEEDVALREFSDEIEPWIIEEFRKVGLDTAKTILALTKEELAKRTDLEEETVIEVLKILNSEFE